MTSVLLVELCNVFEYQPRKTSFPSPQELSCLQTQFTKSPLPPIRLVFISLTTNCHLPFVSPMIHPPSFFLISLLLCPNITPFGQNNLVLKVEFGKLVLDDLHVFPCSRVLFPIISFY